MAAMQRGSIATTLNCDCTTKNNGGQFCTCDVTWKCSILQPHQHLDIMTDQVHLCSVILIMYMEIDWWLTVTMYFYLWMPSRTYSVHILSHRKSTIHLTSVHTCTCGIVLWQTDWARVDLLVRFMFGECVSDVLEECLSFGLVASLLNSLSPANIV